MFMILVIHTDYQILGKPSHQEFVNTPIYSSLKIIFENIGIIGVNLFVLISGYFGIHPSKKGFLKLLFQIVFIYIFVYLISITCGYSHFSKTDLLEIIFVKGSAWFIRAYLFLYIISPILNNWINKSNRHEQKCLIILFFLFEIIFGWFGEAKFFHNGYSVTSFVGLYLTAGYIRKYKYSINHYVIWYLLSLSLTIIIQVLSVSFAFKEHFFINKMISYICPFVILNSICFFCMFKNIQIKTNRIINGIASSAFAVYLLHANSWFFPQMKMIINKANENYHGYSFLLICLIILITIYSISIGIDKIRFFIWSKISIYL